jgi:hypothetical protein
MFISHLTTLEAWLVGIAALSLIGLGALAWLARRGQAPAMSAAGSKARLEAAATELDGQAAALLELMRGYIDAGERYSVSLAQADKKLLTQASPKQIAVIVKFLLAENAKMQNEAR